MRLFSIAAAGGFAVLALAGCRREEPPMRAPDGPTVAQRVRVLNADVLVVDGRHIRLADAAAPQQIPQARCWAEALAAKQATVAVRQLMRDARDIRVEPTGQIDEYNRVVARVALDNQDLSEILHDAGWAAKTTARRFGWCDPISQDGPGAPPLRALMDLGSD